jgi:hypothetical protein
MCRKPRFPHYFNVNDPQAKSNTIIVNENPSNYIAHAFLSIPIYNN